MPGGNQIAARFSQSHTQLYDSIRRNSRKVDDAEI